eukprot:scaffold4200_cov85-Skeletonema_dohrnii-CCMP3373.AAC.2
MAVNRGTCGVPNWPSSGHLRRCSDAVTSNQCLSRREIRYGARVALAAVQIGPHQVTYDVVATPIRPTNA